MIYESWYWKKPLLDMAQRLKSLKIAIDAEDSDEVFAQIERDIFIGFYSIRKLIEAITKVTDKNKNKKIHLLWHPNIKEVNWRNNHKIDELYDLEKQNIEIRNIQFISNQIIHSFIFAPIFDEKDKLDGIFFTSDKEKANKVYRLNIDSIIEIFEAIGNDDPSQIKWKKDPKTLEETFVIK